MGLQKKDDPSADLDLILTHEYTLRTVMNRPDAHFVGTKYGAVWHTPLQLHNRRVRDAAPASGHATTAMNSCGTHEEGGVQDVQRRRTTSNPLRSRRSVPYLARAGFVYM
jgi:hypothetical protein